jgi:hypothetical protein
VNLTLSSPTGGATLGSQSNALLTIVNTPDKNAVPASGPLFFKATITGIEGNSLSKTLNLSAGVATDVLLSSYFTSLQQVRPITASKTVVTRSGFSISTTFNNMEFGYVKATGPGVVPITSDGASATVVWSLSSLAGGTPGPSYNYVTTKTGASGSITIDALDTSSKIVAGRFDFIAVENNGTNKVHIVGSFRSTNMQVN